MASPRRRKPPGANTRGGWGHNHQRRRAAIAPLVNAGKATCARCGEPIHSQDDWHLNHNASRNGYLGPSQPAATSRPAQPSSTDDDPQAKAEQPEMSYRWYDDPPIGTINVDGGRNPEIYLGNCDWAAAR